MGAKTEKKLLKLVRECIKEHGSLEDLYYQCTEGQDVSERLQETQDLMYSYEVLGDSLVWILNILTDDLAKKAR